VLFAGLVVVLLLQPALPGQDLTADDLVVVVAMWLVALVPGVLFARGVASRTPPDGRRAQWTQGERGGWTMTRILVLGGTGLLGRPVVDRLVADGRLVRVLSRDPDRARVTLPASVEVVGGDVTDPGSVAAAVSGCDGVHISVGGPVDRASAEVVAQVAAGGGVERVTYVSGSTVDERNRWFPMVAQKLDAEAAVIASGVPYTILRPTWPMEQLPRFVRDGRATVIGDVLPGWHWFAAADLARMVSTAFTSPQAAGRVLYVHGPHALSMVEALREYCAAAHPGVEVSVLPVAAARALASRSGDPMLSMMAQMMAYFDAAQELGDPAEANAILGAPTTTLAQWIDQDAGFRSSAPPTS
jgi:uncharacterized protein YbjT (DUF2867 family)